MSKNHICWCVVFLWKNWWIMKLWFVESKWFHVNCCWWCFETCWWRTGVRLCMLVNWWWKSLLLFNKFKSLVKFWFETKIVFDSWVLSILVYVFMYMTCKLHLERVLSVGGSKLECLGKRAVYFEVYVFLNQFCFSELFLASELNLSFWTILASELNLSFWTIFGFWTKFELLNYFWLLN